MLTVFSFCGGMGVVENDRHGEGKAKRERKRKGGVKGLLIGVFLLS